MANALDNPLMASNELSYDFSGFDIDMNDLYEKNARRGGDSHAVWDEEAGQYHLATVAPHSEMDLALSGQTIEDITTVDYSEPVYFVGSGSHEMGEVSRQWAVQEDGTVSKTEGWMTESQLREQWNRKEGMGAFKKANPDMTFDSYFAMIQDGTMRYQEAGGLDWNLAELAADHGIQTTWKNGDGDVFNFTGSGYAKSYKVDDHLGPGGYMKMAIMAGAGLMVAAPLATALTPSLGAAGAKAASSAITNIVKQLVTEGGLDIKDALMSAALSYGGSQLSDALAGSGVLGDIGSKVTDFGNKLTEGGGDILTAAMEAGGMSLVSQLVQEGEIDWKDAALAAAMAGGTTALKGLLSNIGKSDEMDNLEEWDEYDEWQQEAIDADIKDPFLNPNYKTVGDGLVMNINTGEVFGQGGIDSKSYGQFDDLDKDGDGALKGNDLSEIATPDREWVDPNPNDITTENPYAKDGARVYIDSDGKIYTQDQIGNYVDGGGEYGDFYMVDGQPVLLEQGTMMAGRYMFDGDGDGVFDAVYNENGALVGSYDSETKQWVDVDGNVSASIGEYMQQVNGSGGADITNPFNMTKEQYDAMTGDELMTDLFQNKGNDGLLALTDGEMEALVARFERDGYNDPVTGDRLYGGEALERYMQRNGYGVHYSSTNGWRIQAGQDTTDGIYGIIEDGKTIDGLEGTDKLGLGIRKIGDIKTPSLPTNKDPFKDPPPEPVDPQDPDKPKTHVLDGGSKDGGGGGGEGAPGDPSTNGTSGPSGSTNPTPTPTPNPTDYSQIVEIAKIAGTTVMDVIDRLNKGETVDQITGKGSGTPIQTPGTDTNAQNPPAATNPNTKPGGGGGGGTTDSGGDSTGDTTGGETGGDTSGGGDNTPGDNSGGKDGTSDTGGATEGEDTGGTVTHVLGGGSVAGGVGQGGGPGSGTGTGGGNGNGNGEGNGDGNGNGNGNGDGFGDSLGGGGGRDRPVFGDLFQAAPFRKHKPHQPKVTQRLFQGMDWNR